MSTQLINKIKDLIVREYNPDKIILFGSYAWGSPHKDSDIDLLIIKKRLRKNVFERTADVLKILQKGRPYGKDIDIFVYNNKEVLEKYTNKPFISNVIDNGKTLYEKVS